MDDFVRTKVQTFCSPFPSPSSPSPGNNLKVGNEDEYQDTVPLDDTDVQESLSIETQLVNLGVESEPLDKLENTDDIEKQVVLDSDDEGTDRTDAASIMKRISSTKTQRSAAGPTLGYVGYLRKRSKSVGPKTLGANCSAISSLSDKESHCDPKSVHTVTQYKKLRVEEQLNGRIVNKFDRDCDCDSWECNDKGSKNSDLITKVSSDTGKNVLLVTCDHEVQTSYYESQEPEDPSNALDFVDHYLSVIDVNLPQEIENRKTNRIKSPPALCAKGSQSLAWRANLRTKNQASSSFDWDENQTNDGGGFDFRKLKEKNANSSSTESRFMVQNSSETIQDSSVTRNDTNFVAELNKQFDASSSGQQQENEGIGTDTAEIFDTQMAAEVMEELLNAPLPNKNATAHQGLENILEDPPKEAMLNKPFASLEEKPDPGITGRRSNRTKKPSKKLRSSFGTLSENKKVLNPKRKKVDKYISTSKSVKQKPVCKEQLTGTFSPIACRTRRNNNASIDNVVEVNVVKRKRNMNSNSKLNQNEEIEPVVAASISSNIDMWTYYPKRKRTRPSYKKSEKVDIVNSGAVENTKLGVLPPVHKKKGSKLPLSKELNRLGFTDRLPDFTSKDLRRRRTTANVRVLFSQSLDDDIMKHQKKISARLGLSVASCCSDATHFITDRFVRTSNMLEAIGAGKPVVTHFWLDSCAQASCLVDEKMYILRDEKKEKEIGFSMPLSLARAKESPLLKGRRVFTTPNVKPGKEIIESLVKAVQGQALDNIERDAIKGKRLPDDLLILSCEEDYSICEPLLEEGAAVYSSELLLSGIVTHKLDYKRHELFIDHVRRKCNQFSNTYSRKNKVLPPCPCN